MSGVSVPTCGACWCQKAMWPPLEPCWFGWAVMPPGATVTSGPELLSRVMSGSMTWVSVDVHGFSNHRKPCLLSHLRSDGHAARDILIWVTCSANGAMVTFGPRLLQKTISVFAVQLQLQSELMSVTFVSG